VDWFSQHPAVRKSGIGVVSVSFGATYAMLMALQCAQVMTD
jgi:dienelactone hydrolase